MRTIRDDRDGNESRTAWLLGKHALVTGASSGIGNELAKQLVGTCRKLTLVARNHDRKLNGLKNELEALLASGCLKRSTVIETYSIDVRHVDKTAALIGKIYGKDRDQVDVFVNCAGGSHVYGTFESMSRADIESIFDVNAKAPIFWLRELLPRMKKNIIKSGDSKRAHVIMLSSRSGERTLPKLSVYTAAKGAVEKLIEAMQKEYAQHRIAFTLINPGSINTAFTARWSRATRNAHNEESMTVAQAVEPIMQVLQVQYATNKVSYESMEQWLNEPGVLRHR